MCAAMAAAHAGIFPARASGVPAPAIFTENHANADWYYGGFSAFLGICEIQVDRNDSKGFVPLAFDTTPATSTPNRSRLLP
jgi:hypothetical protein